MKIIIFAISFVLVIILSSCNGKEEDTPVFIQIDTVQVIINDDDKEGNNNHNISDVWVYVDDNYQGCYEIPAKFPILSKGNHKVTIKAGVKTNGISATREFYPFYTFIDIDTNLIEGSTLKLNPKFSYISNSDIWVEDFNDIDFQFSTIPNSLTDTTFQRVKHEGEANNFYVAAYVNSERTDFFQGTSVETDPIEYGDAARRLFLEFEYKNNNQFYVSLVSDKRHIIEVINPSTEWNKIYIDLTPTIKLNPALTYSLVFDTKYDGIKQGEVFIDNVKLVHYE